MTIPTANIRMDYAGNGSAVTFPYNYKAFANTDLRVLLTEDATGVAVTQTLTTHYTVSGVGAESGGNVVMVTAPPVGYTLTILATIANTQTTDLVNETRFYQSRIEDRMDKLCRADQVQAEKQSRSMVLPESEAGDPTLTTLPPLAERKGKTQAYDAITGAPVMFSTASTAVSAVMEPVLQANTLPIAWETFGYGDTVNAAHYCTGDGVSDDTVGWVAFIAAVRAKGHDCQVLIPPGVYRLRPDLHYSVDYSWRLDTELVDVYNISVIGYGATVWVDVPSAWGIGDITNHANEEGPIQFRTYSGDGACHDISVCGLRILGTRMSGSYVSDGNSFGVAFRGVRRTLVVGVKCENWSTDGIYIGKSYSDTYSGSDHQLIGCRCEGNMRQGLSVVGNDRGVVSACYFGNTYGSSFGHGIDLEPNSGIQYDWTITGCDFKDNQRGALNVIRSRRVVFHGNTLDERYTGATPGAGAIYIDGGASGSEVRGVLIANNTIIANKAILYVSGDYIEDFDFNGNTCECSGSLIAGSYLMVRLIDGVGNKRFRFARNRFSGWGGFQLCVNDEMTFEDNVARIYKNGAAVADVFASLTTASGAVYPTICSIRRNRITVEADVVHAGTRDCYIVHGVVEGNEFISHAAAVLSMQDQAAGRTVRIGCNQFSTYFYFKGLTSSRDVKTDMPAYQRGIFTPTIEGTTTAGVGTYTTQSGEYVRIGQMVTISMTLTWTAHTGTGSIRVAGLPFTSSSITGITPAVAMASNNLVVAAGQVRAATVESGLASMLLLREDPAGGAANLVAIDVAASVTITCTYMAQG